MANTEAPRPHCCAKIYSASIGWGHACSRYATKVHDGKPYCSQHFPPANDARRKARDTALDEALRERDRARMRADQRQCARADALELVRYIAKERGISAAVLKKADAIVAQYDANLEPETPQNAG